MSRSSLKNPADIAHRDAKIVKLWNAGLSSQGLGERFGLTAATINAIVDAARQRGEKVRKPVGRSNW